MLWVRRRRRHNAERRVAGESITMLTVSVISPDGSAGKFRIDGGFLQVLNDTVRVVTEKAETA